MNYFNNIRCKDNQNLGNTRARTHNTVINHSDPAHNHLVISLLVQPAKRLAIYRHLVGSAYLNMAVTQRWFLEARDGARGGLGLAEYSELLVKLVESVVHRSSVCLAGLQFRRQTLHISSQRCYRLSLQSNQNELSVK